MSSNKKKGEPLPGVYLHFPFCNTICPYCNFAVERLEGSDPSAYLSALLASVEAATGFMSSDTLYIGGGTPSLIGHADLKRLFETLIRLGYRFDEVTLEANAEDLSRERLESWRKLGVNRLSIGVQRLDAAGLKRLGRGRSRQAIARLPSLLEVWQGQGGTASVDYIYGLSGDRSDGVGRDIEELLTWPIQHLSAYALTVEPNTPFEKLRLRGQSPAADDDLARGCYAAIGETLDLHGWDLYELSNFCLPGHRARHNSKYWQRVPYLGLGLGAHSYSHDSQSDERLRFRRHPAMAAYLDQPLGRQDLEVLTAAQVGAEQILVGLRSFVGVDRDLLERWRQADRATVNQLIEDEVLEFVNQRVLLPWQQRPLAEEIAARWVTAIF